MLNRLKDIGSKAWDLIDTPLAERANIAIPDDPLFLDEVGNFLLNEATRPSNLLIAAAGGTPAVQGLRAGGKLGRLAANVIEPVAQGGFATRLGGEVGVAAGATAAAKAGAMTGNPLIAAGAGLAGGIASGSGITRVGKVGVALPPTGLGQELHGDYVSPMGLPKWITKGYSNRDKPIIDRIAQKIAKGNQDGLNNNEWGVWEMLTDDERAFINALAPTPAEAVLQPLLLAGKQTKPFDIADASRVLTRAGAAPIINQSPISQLEHDISAGFSGYDMSLREKRKREGAQMVAGNLSPDFIDELLGDPDWVRNLTIEGGELAQDATRNTLAYVQRQITDAWQEGYSGTSNPDSLNVYTQSIAQKAFPHLTSNTPGSPRFNNPDIRSDAFHRLRYQLDNEEQMDKILPELMKAEYKTTQDILSSYGFKPDDKIVLYRGVNASGAEWDQFVKSNPEKFLTGKEGHSKLQMADVEQILQTEKGATPGLLTRDTIRKANKVPTGAVFPLSSWTPDISTARLFGSPQSYSGIMLAAEIPVNRILSLPKTGRGSIMESELVVIGATEEGATAFVDTSHDFTPKYTDITEINSYGGGNNVERFQNAQNSYGVGSSFISNTLAGKEGFDPYKFSDTNLQTKGLKAQGYSPNSPEAKLKDYGGVIKAPETSTKTGFNTVKKNYPVTVALEKATTAISKADVEDIEELSKALQYYKASSTFNPYITILQNEGLTDIEAAWLIENSSLTELDEMIAESQNA